MFDGGGAVSASSLWPRRRHHHAEYGFGQYHQDPNARPPAAYFPDCPIDCQLYIPNIHEVRETFQDLLEDSDTRLVHFKIYFTGYNRSLLEVGLLLYYGYNVTWVILYWAKDPLAWAYMRGNII